ncbi:hypothetical protein NLU13_4620 [Sarocladium strictum]|uniref:Uncharacterized protein n=1 Tax=Sarocladium strictum TaxID=5046 RepID=A0AA39GJ80_SARSR|nr:hypothetical protein NLU13_4620 [Sarocladium strictum]
MSSPLFCCSSIQPYRPQRLSHDAKFTSFILWASFPREAQPEKRKDGTALSGKDYAIQLVRQVNFGPLETIRYFVPTGEDAGAFVEISGQDLIQANFQKVNTYKNYKCLVHNKFFEVNVYQKDPVNLHHWRANLARPAAEIDLQPQATTQVTSTPVTQSQVPIVHGASHRSPSPDSDSDSDMNRASSWVMSSRGGYGNDSDDDFGKDFAACDKECGYCGRCEY